MRSKKIKIFVCILSLLATGLTGLLTWHINTELNNLPLVPHYSLPSEELHDEELAHEGEDALAAAEGGAHGEPPPADEHGAPPADPHGAPPADPHGAPAGEANAQSLENSLYTIDEIMVNLGSLKFGGLRLLKVKINLELFDSSLKPSLEKSKAGLKDTIIEASREQDYAQLNSLPGKLYFKEILVARINKFLNQPVVRNVHFTDFFLQ